MPTDRTWSAAEREQIEALLQTSPTDEARREIGAVVIRAAAARHVRDRVIATGGRLYREKYRPASSQLALLRPGPVQGSVAFVR